MQLPGAEKVLNIFGHWPSFHDAEVVRFVLEVSDSFLARPSIIADVHAFEMTDQIGEDGAYVLKHHTLISFRFAGVVQLKLDDFNNQNVLWDLYITDIRDRQMEFLNYEVHFNSSYGMDAQFLCQQVTIESVEPFDGTNEFSKRLSA